MHIGINNKVWVNNTQTAPESAMKFTSCEVVPGSGDHPDAGLDGRTRVTGRDLPCGRRLLLEIMVLAESG